MGLRKGQFNLLYSDPQGVKLVATGLRSGTCHKYNHENLPRITITIIKIVRLKS